MIVSRSRLPGSRNNTILDINTAPWRLGEKEKKSKRVGSGQWNRIFHAMTHTNTLSRPLVLHVCNAPHVKGQIPIHTQSVCGKHWKNYYKSKATKFSVEKKKLSTCTVPRDWRKYSGAAGVFLAVTWVTWSDACPKRRPAHTWAATTSHLKPTQEAAPKKISCE